MTCHTDNIRI